MMTADGGSGPQLHRWWLQPLLLMLIPRASWGIPGVLAAAGEVGTGLCDLVLLPLAAPRSRLAGLLSQSWIHDVAASSFAIAAGFLEAATRPPGVEA